MICDRCFGRLRRLLDDAPDLLGRLRAIGDPSKATVLDQVRVSSSSVEASAPIGDDLLDAIAAVELVLAEYGRVDGDYLTWASNHLETIEWLGAMVLDRHAPVDGIRALWSVQDAVDRWGVERRDRTPRVDDVEDDFEESVWPVAEWGDPLLNREEADVLAGSSRTLRRWIRTGGLAPAGTIWVAGIRTSIFRRSEILAAQERARERQASSLKQHKTTNPLNRTQEES